MRVNVLRTGGVVALATTAALFAATGSAGATTAGVGEGSAYAAQAKLSLLPKVIGEKGLTVDSGKIAASSTAGPNSASVVDVPLKNVVTAKVISSKSKHDATSGEVKSSASITKARLALLQTLTQTVPGADLIASKCTSTSDGTTADSTILNLNLGKFGTVPVHPSANQKIISVPGIVTIIANEQIKNDDGSTTVNALDIKLLGEGATQALGSGSIVLASSTCGKASGGTTTTPTTPPQTPTPTATTAPAPTGGQVSQVPSGAPETGDGSLATSIIK